VDRSLFARFLAANVPRISPKSWGKIRGQRSLKVRMGITLVKGRRFTMKEAATGITPGGPSQNNNSRTAPASAIPARAFRRLACLLRQRAGQRRGGYRGGLSGRKHALDERLIGEDEAEALDAALMAQQATLVQRPAGPAPIGRLLSRGRSQLALGWRRQRPPADATPRAVARAGKDAGRSGSLPPQVRAKCTECESCSSGRVKSSAMAAAT
jgi:hypothetical protein